MIYTQVKIDGDIYNMHIPSMEQVAEVSAFVDKSMSDHTKDCFNSPILCYTNEELYPIFYRYTMKPQLSDMIGKITEDGDIFDNGCLCSLKPYLVPVDEEGNEKPFSQEDFPDGIMTYGGSIFVNDKHYKGTPVVHNAKIDKVSIGDTDDEVLGFMAHKGVLWCLTAIIHASPVHIFHTWDWRLK